MVLGIVGVLDDLFLARAVLPREGRRREEKGRDRKRERERELERESERERGSGSGSGPLCCGQAPPAREGNERKGGGICSVM